MISGFDTFVLLVGSAAAGLGSALVVDWFTERISTITISRVECIAWVARRRPGIVVRTATSRSRLAGSLARAGFSSVWSEAFMLGMKQVLFWGSTTLLVIFAVMGSIPVTTVLLIALPVWYATLRGPEIICSVAATRRQQQCERQLPQLIDALIVYGEAGLNLESSIREYAQRSMDTLAHEWHRFVLQLDRGVRFSDALQHLRERFHSEEFHRFLTTVQQSQQLGTPFASALAVHAEYLRVRRKHRAEERARTAAVKISIPLVVFIFPALLIVFLGPAALQLLQSWS